MKTKIEKHCGCFYPMIKNNWYSRWKYIAFYQYTFKTYKSVFEYWRDWNTSLYSNIEEAEKIIDKFKDNTL